ncbi:MAG: RNA-binding domain-containing protein [Candidatus Woesearchaeota archaeon]
MFHNVKIRSFEKIQSKEEFALVCEKIIGLNLKQEKIEVIEDINKGFENKNIYVYTCTITKKRQVKSFIKNLNEAIIDKSFINQENRLDDYLRFFLRLDKKALKKEIFELVEHGDCYHITMQVAAYPKKKDVAREVIKEVFK